MKMHTQAAFLNKKTKQTATPAERKFLLARKGVIKGKYRIAIQNVLNFEKHLETLTPGSPEHTRTANLLKTAKARLGMKEKSFMHIASQVKKARARA